MNEPRKIRIGRLPLLTRAEWIVLAKLIAIFGMSVVLLQANISFDYERIFYEGVDSLSNTGTALGPSIPLGSGPLGTDKGLGFGWEDINIYRLALDYRYSDQWTFRGGLSMNDQPIPDDQLLFNILAPAVIRKHATLGFTYRPNTNSEWSLAYMHAFKETVSSNQTAFGVPGKIDMYQNSVDVGYAMKF